MKDCQQQGYALSAGGAADGDKGKTGSGKGGHERKKSL